MAQRIKGQEVEVLAIVDGSPQRSINAVRSFEFNYQLETTSEGYLGESANRRDSIYRGITGRMELHLDNAAIFDFVESIVDRARRRTAGVVINIKATLRFPSGDRPRVIIQDVEFGEIPFNAGSRSDYVMVTLPFESAEAKRIN